MKKGISPRYIRRMSYEERGRVISSFRSLGLCLDVPKHSSALAGQKPCLTTIIPCPFLLLPWHFPSLPAAVLAQALWANTVKQVGELIPLETNMQKTSPLFFSLESFIRGSALTSGVHKQQCQHKAALP